MSSWLFIARERVRNTQPGWRAFSPEYGPCWAVAWALADAGWGKVFRCKTYGERWEDWYNHYIVITPEGTVIDLCGEWLEFTDCIPRYTGLQIAERVHEHYREEHIAFWKEKLEL